MLSRKTIEAYLFFLLRHKFLVSVVVAVLTFVLGWSAFTRMHVFTNFFDLYPPNHPYIKLYQQYRGMFGTANTLILVVEVKKGTIFDDPETVQKVDRLTLALLHEVPGVNGEQVLSITHPKLKTTLTAGSGIKVVPLMYPRVPETKEDLEFLKLKVYTTEGVHGFFVSEDDKATQIVAGFWEEYFDLPEMWRRVQELAKKESDENTTIYVTGPPVLYAYFLEAMPKMVGVLAASIVMILLILWVEFRSWQGVVIPIFSGSLSAIWGLGFGGLWGLTLDPLVLVIPLLISARAHSHSVQSMERYHEEYHRLRDKEGAIVKSYTEIYAPAMVSLLADGLATLTLLVARIPLIQKLAILCSFWIISIFVSVVTLHPIILSFTSPPEEFDPQHKGALERFMSWMIVVAVSWLLYLYGHVPDVTLAAVGSHQIGIVGAIFLFTLLGGLADLFGTPLPLYAQLGVAVSHLVDWFGTFWGSAYLMLERCLIWLAGGWRRQIMLVALVALLAFAAALQQRLRIGDATPGGVALPRPPVQRRVQEGERVIHRRESARRDRRSASYCTGRDGRRARARTAALRARAGECVRCRRVKFAARGCYLATPGSLNNLGPSRATWPSGFEVGGYGHGGDAPQEDLPHVPRGRSEVELLPTATTTSPSSSSCSPGTRRGEMDCFFDGELHERHDPGLLQGLHERDDRRVDRARQGVHRGARRRGERPLPIGWRPDRHPRGRERGGGVLVPRQPPAHPRRRVHAELRDLRVDRRGADRDAALARRAAALRGGDVPPRHRLQHQLPAGRGHRHRHRDRLRVLRALAHRRGAGGGGRLRRRDRAHVPDDRKDRDGDRRVAHGEHHLLGDLPDEVPGRDGLAAGPLARLPSDGRPDVHSADGVALQAELRDPLRRGAPADSAAAAAAETRAAAGS
ncbi:MAG: MMPL family transporter [Candidatus Binatia bacterium]